MANERSDRDQRGRYEQRDRGARDSGDRGFFERAGDEISSWFGDDEAERRREMDERSGRSFGDRDDGRRFYGAQDDRSPRYRDETRRPYSGRPPERSEMSRDMARRGPDFDRDQGSPYRPLTGDYGRAADDRFDRQPPQGRGTMTPATGRHRRA